MSLLIPDNFLLKFTLPDVNIVTSPSLGFVLAWPIFLLPFNFNLSTYLSMYVFLKVFLVNSGLNVVFICRLG